LKQILMIIGLLGVLLDLIYPILGTLVASWVTGNIPIWDSESRKEGELNCRQATDSCQDSSKLPVPIPFGGSQSGRPFLDIRLTKQGLKSKFGCTETSLRQAKTQGFSTYSADFCVSEEKKAKKHLKIAVINH